MLLLLLLLCTLSIALAHWLTSSYNRLCHSNVSVTAPSRVTDVSLTKTVENGTSALRVSWASPQSNVNISQYQVQYRSGTNSWNSATTILVSPPATSTILIGLDAGTEYTVRVRAESYDRAGNWSVEQKERTFSDGGFYVLSVCIYTCGAHSDMVK